MKTDDVTAKRSTASAMSGILISRFFGFLREIVVASVFGLSPQIDAFFAAYRIPNFFRTLLGEGSLSAAFVPVLSRTIVSEGKEASAHLTRAFFSVVLIISGAITLAGIAFSSTIISIVAPGFSPETHDLAARVMRIIFPFFMFLVLGAWAMGILHTRGRFFIPSVAPVCLSGSQIVFLLMVSSYFACDPLYALAWGVLIGGVLQFLVQVPVLLREGYSIRPVWDPGLAEIRRIGTLFVPVVIALGVNQLNSLVDTFLSSFLAHGSLASLSYATRLYTFPLSLFGVSIAMVALPSLSKGNLSENQPEVGHADRVRAWWLRTLFFLIPSTAFLAVFSSQVVSLIFERGAFGEREVWRVSGVLLFYAVGLPAFGSVKILVSGFHSLQDTRTPMKLAIISTTTNIVLSVLLMQIIEVRGIALATSISACLHVTLLVIGLTRKTGERIIDRALLGAVVWMVLSGFVMVVAGFLLWRRFLAVGWDEGFSTRFLGLTLTILLMGGLYLLLARLVRFGGVRRN